MDDTMRGTTPQGSHRKTFNDEVLERSITFAKEILLAVPELEGIAVIPSFTVPQEHLPNGVIVGRCGPLQTPGELMHMSMQLHAAMRQQMDSQLAGLAFINNQLKQMQAHLQGLREETATQQSQLNDVNNALSQHQPAAAHPGHAPG